MWWSAGCCQPNLWLSLQQFLDDCQCLSPNHTYWAWPAEPHLPNITSAELYIMRTSPAEPHLWRTSPIPNLTCRTSHISNLTCRTSSAEPHIYWTSHVELHVYRTSPAEPHLCRTSLAEPHLCRTSHVPNGTIWSTFGAPPKRLLPAPPICSLLVTDIRTNTCRFALISSIYFRFGKSCSADWPLIYCYRHTH